MKKKIIIGLMLLLAANSTFAKDYAKLQVKEMKHAQKYGSTQKYFDNSAYTKTSNTQNVTVNYGLKDPKLIKLGNYDEILQEDYEKKLNIDNEKYQKIKKSFGIRTVDNYNAQAKGENYYQIYRIAEKIIRANKLDFINWRIGIYRDSEEPNAFNTNMNYIAISTALYDTFSNNDDALAMVIGHEMGHALLGHAQRKAQINKKLSRAYRLALNGAPANMITYKALERKYLIESKNMEYAADLEGAKLAAKAGYKLDSGSEILSFLNTLPTTGDFWSDHPDINKRIENLNENRKYFMEDEWEKIGKFNIYNSEVLDVNLSSDRKSIVINAPENKLSEEQYYKPEPMEDLYLRFGYKYYLNRDFEKSLKYFDELFKLKDSDSVAYLYASYSAQQLYKLKGNNKYLELAKEYANKANQLCPNNKYITEQINSL